MNFFTQESNKQRLPSYNSSNMYFRSILKEQYTENNLILFIWMINHSCQLFINKHEQFLLIANKEVRCDARVGSWQKHSHTHKRTHIAMLLPGLPGRETGPKSCTFPPFRWCSPTLQPRRPRHAQQTSPTTRSGRHATFIMFPRSNFDGSTPAESSVHWKDNRLATSASFALKILTNVWSFNYLNKSWCRGRNLTWMEI